MAVPLQLEPVRGIFQVEADDGPVELAGRGVATILDRFVLILANRTRSEGGFQFPFQPAVDLSFQQMLRGGPAVREEESEAAAAAKIHDALGLGLHPVAEHVGEGLDLGDYEMPRSEINGEIRIGPGLQLAPPVRNIDGLLPIEKYLFAAFQILYEIQFQPRFVLNLPSAFFGVENTASILRLVRHLPAGLQYPEVVDVEPVPVLEPEDFAEKRRFLHIFETEKCPSVVLRRPAARRWKGMEFVSGIEKQEYVLFHFACGQCGRSS